ncbi:MAG TPA: glycosyltransferase family 2 protein [Candidatus Omnitrophota bacterium]|nr:glycosyltransferase family 2 protein [Candidatus Omnitrophota bacterium]HPS36805.1 glycosyltransferase family 2 protein [Candidatus Omnitrophota bacterium]
MVNPEIWPFVSVLILNFNGKSWLKECLDSIENSDYPKERYEVILGDNASTDDSVVYVREHYPEVRVIAFDDNYGFCRSNNLCAKEARGEYLVFLNNDTSVTVSWLTELVRGALSDPVVVSCASKILFPPFRQAFSLSKNPERQRASLLNSAGGRIFITGSSIYDGWMQEDGPAYDFPKDTGFGCAAGVLVEQKFFLETGGFDEYYFHSVEEMDLGWRAWSRGKKVRYIPSAVMYHWMGKTGTAGGKMPPEILFLVLRNSLYFIVKNFEFFTALRGLLLFFAKTFFTLGYTLGTGNGAAFLAVGRAYGCFLKDLGKAFRARTFTQKERTIGDRELLKAGVLAGGRDVLRMTFSGLRDQKERFPGGLYDKKDIMKIRENKQGRFVFHRTSQTGA